MVASFMQLRYCQGQSGELRIQSICAKAVVFMKI